MSIELKRSNKVIVIGQPRHSKFLEYIKHVERLTNKNIAYDITAELRLQEVRTDFSKWVKVYFQHVLANNYTPVITELIRKPIKLGVKKRYIKTPAIKMVSTREYYNFHVNLTDNLMRQKKYPKRPTLKAESIFETEKRLQKEAKQISQTFVHTKPVKFLLK